MSGFTVRAHFAVRAQDRPRWPVAFLAQSTQVEVVLKETAQDLPAVMLDQPFHQGMVQLGGLGCRQPYCQRLGRLDRAGKRVRDVVGVVAFHPGSSSGQSFLVGTYECRKKSPLNTGS